jgi:integrase
MLAPATGLAIQLAILTLQRGGEVVGIHANEIDRAARLWTIPGERTKNHRTHVVPLSAAASAVLEQAFALALDGAVDVWKGYAFPSTTRTNSPITRHAVSRAVNRLAKVLQIDDVTPHDFRRTGATFITGEQIRVPRLIVSRILNQISDTGGAAAVTGVYDRNEYLADKREALDAWADRLTDIVRPNK